MPFKKRPFYVAFHDDQKKRIERYILEARYEIEPDPADVVHHAVELFLKSKKV
jgi:hypothetical protein